MKDQKSAYTEEVILEFSENDYLPALFGEQNKNLDYLEKKQSVRFTVRGNILVIEGSHSDQVNATRSIITLLYEKAKSGLNIDHHEIESVINLAGDPFDKKQKKSLSLFKDEKTIIITKKRNIVPRSHLQYDYIKALKERELTVAIGPAGTGKTYLAVAAGVAALLSGQVERLILSRPAVEAGEKIGFLPGDMKSKIDPYLIPLYDALYDMLPSEEIDKKIISGEIEIAPLGFMRGRTLSNSFIILDEAQNTTDMQMKMFLTRIGENSSMAIAGDLTQTDLPKGILSGLRDSLSILSHIDDVKIVRFSEKDVVRHPLVMKIVNEYAKRNDSKN